MLLVCVTLRPPVGQHSISILSRHGDTVVGGYKAVLHDGSSCRWWLAHSLGTSLFGVRSPDQGCDIRCINLALNIIYCVLLSGWSAASKLGQVRLSHIARVFRMTRHYKPLFPSTWCLYQAKYSIPHRGELRNLSWTPHSCLEKNMGTKSLAVMCPVFLLLTSKEPVCPRVELILKIIIILQIIFLGFIKSKPC